MSRLGIEFLSVFGLHPVEHVRLAAELGCGHISTGLFQYPQGPEPWSLLDDAALRRDMIQVMKDVDVSISLGEGFAVRPDADMADRGHEMDIMAELGARGLGAVSMEPDQARALDQFAILAEMANERGMLATIEFAPAQVVGSLAEALAVVHHVGRPDFRLLIDAMHLFRSGGAVAEIAALDPALIGYAQLCDVPIEPTEESYLTEAMTARLAPGDGELPLAEFVAALPRDIPIGLEVPNQRLLESGLSHADRLRPAVEAARKLDQRPML